MKLPEEKTCYPTAMLIRCSYCSSRLTSRIVPCLNNTILKKKKLDFNVIGNCFCSDWKMKMKRGKKRGIYRKNKFLSVLNDYLELKLRFLENLTFKSCKYFVFCWVISKCGYVLGMCIFDQRQLFHSHLDLCYTNLCANSCFLCHS